MGDTVCPVDDVSPDDGDPSPVLQSGGRRDAKLDETSIECIRITSDVLTSFCQDRRISSREKKSTQCKLQQFALVQPELVQDTIEPLVLHNNWKVRNTAWEIVRNVTDKDRIWEVCFNCTNQNNSGVRRDAVSAIPTLLLQQPSLQKACVRLAELTEDSCAQVRLATLRSWSSLVAKPDSTEAAASCLPDQIIIRALSDTDADVRVQAAIALRLKASTGFLQDTSVVTAALGSLVIQRSTSPACLQGHSLHEFQAFNEGFTCDECHASVPRGSKLWGCRLCNYDKCSRCMEPPPQASQPGPGSSAELREACMSALRFMAQAGDPASAAVLSQQWCVKHEDPSVRLHALLGVMEADGVLDPIISKTVLHKGAQDVDTFVRYHICNLNGLQPEKPSGCNSWRGKEPTSVPERDEIQAAIQRAAPGPEGWRPHLKAAEDDDFEITDQAASCFKAVAAKPKCRAALVRALMPAEPAKELPSSNYNAYAADFCSPAEAVVSRRLCELLDNPQKLRMAGRSQHSLDMQPSPATSPPARASRWQQLAKRQSKSASVAAQHHEVY